MGPHLDPDYLARHTLPFTPKPHVRTLKLDLGDKDIIGPLCSSSLCGHIELIFNWSIKDWWLNLVDQRCQDLRLGTNDTHHKVTVLNEQNGERNCSVPLGLVGRGAGGGGTKSTSRELGLPSYLWGLPGGQCPNKSPPQVKLNQSSGPGIVLSLGLLPKPQVSSVKIFIRVPCLKIPCYLAFVNAPPRESLFRKSV